MQWLRSGTDDEELFDDADTYVPENLPEPDPFLEGHDVLEGDRHVRVHRTARERFEDSGVYDMTFGYNLAKLNRDRRHPDAGFRYAESATDDGELLVSFTPTTEFCPQGQTLAVGVFRAWNGTDAHEYDLVRVRVNPMHHNSDATNDRIRELAREYEAHGRVDVDPTTIPSVPGDTEDLSGVEDSSSSGNEPESNVFGNKTE